MWQMWLDRALNWCYAFNHEEAVRRVLNRKFTGSGNFSPSMVVTPRLRRAQRERAEQESGRCLHRKPDYRSSTVDYS